MLTAPSLRSSIACHPFTTDGHVVHLHHPSFTSPALDLKLAHAYCIYYFWAYSKLITTLRLRRPANLDLVSQALHLTSPSSIPFPKPTGDYYYLVIVSSTRHSIINSFAAMTSLPQARTKSPTIKRISTCNSLRTLFYPRILVYWTPG